MNEARQRKIEQLSEGVLTTPGDTSSELRAQIMFSPVAIAAGIDEQEIPLPEPLRTYVSKVAKHAYKVTEQDIEELRTAGYSEDAIFEITLSCALGAGLFRLEHSLDLLEN